MFSILAGNKIKSGVGVEVNPAAVECAALSATINGVSSLTFQAADCAKYLEHVAPGRFDTILANPPRRGCGQAVIERLLELAPARLIFSSCNPQTLAADLDLLNRAYKLDSLEPFEMFPLTGHLEILASLTRRPG